MRHFWTIPFFYNYGFWFYYLKLIKVLNFPHLMGNEALLNAV